MTPLDNLRDLLSRVEDAAIAAVAQPATWVKYDANDHATWPPVGVRVLVSDDNSHFWTAIWDRSEADEFARWRIRWWTICPVPPKEEP